MVVMAQSSSSLQPLQLHTHSSINCKSFAPSLLHSRRIYRFPGRIARPSKCPNAVSFQVKAYMGEGNFISRFASKVIGSLPVIGLIVRLSSSEGGIGDDIIDFAEFRRRVGDRCSFNDSGAFVEFQERRGPSGNSLFVLLCCWIAAVGAGLLKSEEILEGVRIYYEDDLEYAEENFIMKMSIAREKRAKLKAPVPNVPMEIRAAKALDAIYVCCFRMEPMEEEDQRLLCIMLAAVFPTVNKLEIDRIVKEKAKRIAEGTDDQIPEPPKPLSKEAVEQQLKELDFLAQRRKGRRRGNDISRLMELSRDAFKARGLIEPPQDAIKEKSDLIELPQDAIKEKSGLIELPQDAIKENSRP